MVYFRRGKKPLTTEGTEEHRGRLLRESLPSTLPLEKASMWWTLASFALPFFERHPRKIWNSFSMQRERGVMKD